MRHRVGEGSAIIVPLNRCDFMAKIGQDGKEQSFHGPLRVRCFRVYLLDEH